MAFIKKILDFLKKKKYLYGIIIVVLLVVAGLFIFKNGKTANGTITISHTDFINQVSISGKVVASEEVDLAFEKEGTVNGVFYSVGESVKAGSLIAKINAKDAEKEVHDAEISLASAKLSLEKFQLESSEDNMSADLEKAYDDGFSTVSDTFVDLSIIITGLEDILDEDNLSANSTRISGSLAVSYRSEAEKLYYQALSEFKENRKNFRLLDRNSQRTDIENILDKTFETTKTFSDAIKSLKNLVDYMADDARDASGFATSKSSLSDYGDTINSHLSSLSLAKKDINDYKEAFPTAGIDLKDLELTVKQKENALQDARNNLSDYYIRAPFDGIITKVDAKVGEIASPNTSLVKIISADVFQIESFVPEVNVALIKLGDSASITLDAYGEDVLFYAKVISIDPAETIRDGVSTYKTKLQFDAKDDRIKSGMTASVTIITFNKPNVIVIPGGVVFDRDGKKFVQIKVGEEVLEKEIVLGITSSLGQVEVISGLSDGDKVVLNPEVE